MTPETLLQVIKDRRSMGHSRYAPQPVDRKVIEMMLEAANWGPSHEDTEPWRFQVFMGEGRRKLGEIFALTEPGKEGVAEGSLKRAFSAPVWISLGMTPKLNDDGSLLMGEEAEVMAVSCAVQNLHLMAQAQGGTEAHAARISKATPERTGASAMRTTFSSVCFYTPSMRPGR